MRIKKLEIFGFKSFGTRQSIIFGDGVTGVVGPNGCGKSNVVDALRWVMGEQNARHLRGSQMQDIIFCGTDKKSPLGFAEVTLTLENTQDSVNTPLEYANFTEIQITRRLYKTNESEFEINKQKVRLKDIQEFFLGTGVGAKAYSIIEQGKVSEMISAKALDRRTIIEEAAGITKYKAKRVAAEKRMQDTKVNLNRIIDIHNEVEKRVEILVKEKEKLDALNDFKKRVFTIDIHLASHKYLELLCEKNYLQSIYEKIQEDILNSKRDISCLEEDFEKALNIFVDKKQESELLEKLVEQHKNSLELIKKDKDFSSKTLQDNYKLVDQLNQQLIDIEKRLIELYEQKNTYEQQKSELQKNLDNIKLEFEEFDKKGLELKSKRQQNTSIIQKEQDSLLRYASLAAQLKGEINSIKEQEKQRIAEISLAESELSQLQKDIEEQKKLIIKLSDEYENAEKNQSEIKITLKEKEQEISIHEQKARSVFQKLSDTQKEIIKISSRLSSLEEIHKSLRWSQSGIHNILADKNQQSKILSVVADALDVEKGYEVLVEKCLFNILDAAIVDSYENLTVLFAWLREQKAQTSHFFCLENTNNIKASFDAVCLKDVVKVKQKKYEILANYLDKIYVFDEIQDALKAWPLAMKSLVNIITKDFILLKCDGSAIFIGQNNENGVLKRKNELEQLAKEVNLLQNTEKNLKEELLAIEQITTQHKFAKEKLLQDLRPLSFGIVRLKESIAQKEIHLNKSIEQYNKLQVKLKNLTNFMINTEEKILELERKSLEYLHQHKQSEEQLIFLKNEQNDISKIYDEYLQDFKKIEMQKLGAFEQIKGLKNLLDQVDKNIEHLLTQKESFTNQINEKNSVELVLEETVRQTSKKIELLEVELVKSEELYKITHEKVFALKQNKENLEKELANFKKIYNSKLEESHKKELAINNSDNSIKSLMERMYDRYQINLQDYLTEYHDKIIDEKEALKEHSSLKQKISSIGSVNENAQHEYEEYKNRKDFLFNQISDLNKALEQLEDAILKINNTTKMRFLEAFNSINAQFSEVFCRLFNGGKAQLILSDENDLLNSGVEIMAKPPGKNINSVELMSGGEKALTAISLIMAIFLIKPSPFCLLDEVDAPLDETNVSRFSNLVAEMSRFCQMIVITHNRKTMEMADRLYGVTMQDAGLSKVVCVEVKDDNKQLKPDNNLENNNFLQN